MKSPWFLSQALFHWHMHLIFGCNEIRQNHQHGFLFRIFLFLLESWHSGRQEHLFAQLFMQIIYMKIHLHEDPFTMKILCPAACHLF